MDKQPERFPVSCEFEGRTCKGTWWIAGRIMTVATGLGGKSDRVGPEPAERQAQALLMELAKAGKA
ncbi:MAG: hypothetical protein JNM82_07095 [Rhodocyclaceae bacterium]|nr:hypothetical protein [Rhodocyclaceae bacterium]